MLRLNPAIKDEEVVQTAHGAEPITTQPSCSRITTPAIRATGSPPHSKMVSQIKSLLALPLPTISLKMALSPQILTVKTPTCPLVLPFLKQISLCVIFSLLIQCSHSSWYYPLGTLLFLLCTLSGFDADSQH